MNAVRLMVVGNSMEAETICGLLRTEGIACDHRQTDVGAGAGDAVGDSGPREILVARDDLESARQVVTTDASPGDKQLADSGPSGIFGLLESM